MGVLGCGRDESFCLPGELGDSVDGAWKLHCMLSAVSDSPTQRLLE